MTNWMNRFALLAAIVGIMGSALVMGCGGGEDESTTNNAAMNSSSNAADTDAP